MWAKIITIKRTKDLNYFSLCALNLFNTRDLQFELNYWINKLFHDILIYWDAPVCAFNNLWHHKTEYIYIYIYAVHLKKKKSTTQEVEHIWRKKYCAPWLKSILEASHSVALLLKWCNILWTTFWPGYRNAKNMVQH